MKTVIIILAIFFAFILGIMILGGMLQGFWNAVGAVPRWVWFIGFLLFLIIWGLNQRSMSNGIDDGLSQVQTGSNDSAKEATVAEEPMLDEKRFNLLVKSMRSPIKFVTVAAGGDDSEPSIISPLFDHGTQAINQHGEPMSVIQLCQETQTSCGGSIRVAEIKASLRELEMMVQENGWHIRKQLTGRIIAVETFHPIWEGHLPITNEAGLVKGISYLGDFYLLYLHYLYTNDEFARDRRFCIEELLKLQEMEK